MKTSNERLRKAGQAREFAYLAGLMDPSVQFEAVNDNFQSNLILYLNLFAWKHCLELMKEISERFYINGPSSKPVVIARVVGPAS